MSADSASVQLFAKTSLSASLNAEAALSAQLGAGAAVVNDYLIRTEEIEDGHRLTITRGSEVQTFDLKNGAPGSKDAVIYTPHTLTTEQQTQARANVGAASAESVQKVEDALPGKLTEPAEGLAVGKYFRVGAIDENGHAVLEAVDAPKEGLAISHAGWPEWTADEQAAARERMGIPGDYELIEEITLEEAVDNINRYNEPDGTAYNLVNAFVSVYVPIQDGGYVPGTIWVYFDNVKRIHAGRLYINQSVNIIRNVYFRAEQRTSNGIWLNPSGEFGQENIVSTRMNVYNVKTENSNITGIYILATLPAGAIIQIYGVRA